MFKQESNKTDANQEAIVATPSSYVRVAWRHLKLSRSAGSPSTADEFLSRSSAIQDVTLRQVPSPPHSNLLAHPLPLLDILGLLMGMFTL